MILRKKKKRPFTGIRRRNRASVMNTRSLKLKGRSESADFQSTSKMSFFGNKQNKTRKSGNLISPKEESEDKIIVFSAINKELKRNLKKKVPLYKDNMMGHVVYQETTSKIIRPCSSKPFYRPNKTIIDRNKRSKILRIKRDLEREKQKIINEYFNEAKKDTIFFQGRTTFFNSNYKKLFFLNNEFFLFRS